MVTQHKEWNRPSMYPAEAQAKCKELWGKLGFAVVPDSPWPPKDGKKKWKHLYKVGYLENKKYITMAMGDSWLHCFRALPKE